MKAEVKSDIAFMARIYNTYERDWLGDPIYTIEQLTRHHIVKKEKGGENGISNYALLTKTSHCFIHYLEDNDNAEYRELNDLFLALNRSCQPPTEKYYEEVARIVKKVKKHMKNNSRTRKKR